MMPRSARMIRLRELGHRTDDTGSLDCAHLCFAPLGMTNADNFSRSATALSYASLRSGLQTPQLLAQCGALIYASLPRDDKRHNFSRSAARSAMLRSARDDKHHNFSRSAARGTNSKATPPLVSAAFRPKDKLAVIDGSVWKIHGRRSSGW